MFSTPEYYKLAWNGPAHAIEIYVHSNILGEITPGRQLHRIQSLKEMFGLDGFYGDILGEIGFRKTLHFSEITGAYYCYMLALPEFGENTKACEYCGIFHDRHCTFCDDARIVPSDHPAMAYAVTASLSIFLRLISYPKAIISTQNEQLLQFGITTNLEINERFAMGGRISPRLQEWIIENMDNEKKELLLNTMKDAHVHMLGTRNFNESKFKIDYDSKDGALHLSCPGNACGINPGNTTDGKCLGYEFQSHNMDNPFQQLTIIAGLAKLCSLTSLYIQPNCPK